MANNDSEKQALTLSQLNNIIKNVINSSFQEGYAVIAEISSIRYDLKNHCYISLVEKQNDTTLAKMEARIWASQHKRVFYKFEQATGETLKPGMKVLLFVKVAFHEIHGLSLEVRDIDPTYTLGEMARKKKEVLERLKRENLIDSNKRFDIPLVPQRIAIISSPHAAGYGDFVKHLENNIYGYKFYHQLFPAIMQGQEAVQSIINAINTIEEQRGIHDSDLVVIVRGGGSQADLSCFDSYELAFKIATCVYPVVTGIGHERDDTVADIVAHTKKKTPTDAAEFMISCVRSFENTVDEYRGRLVAFCDSTLNNENARIGSMIQTFCYSVTSIIDNENSSIELVRHRTTSALRNYMQIQRHGLTNMTQDFLSGTRQAISNHKSNIKIGIQRLIHSVLSFLRQETGYAGERSRKLIRITDKAIDAKRHDIGLIEQNIRYKPLNALSIMKERLGYAYKSLENIAIGIVDIEKSKLDYLDQTLRILEPANTLKRGYSITYHQGKVIKSVKDVSKGSIINTVLYEGSITSKVEGDDGK